jgi:hypothetical protein
MLHEALRVAENERCDEIACLGDIAGFDRRFYRHELKRSARTCLSLIRANCRWIVAGNHDLAAASRFPVYTNGFSYPDDWYGLTPEEKRECAAGRVWTYEGDSPNDLGPEEVEFLNTLPEYINVRAEGADCLFSHYIFPDFTGSTTRYVEKNSQLRELWNFMDEIGSVYAFTGHSHAAFTGFAYRKNNSLSLPFMKAVHALPHDTFNLGSEMMLSVLPALTGDEGRACFSIFDTGSLQLRVIPLRIQVNS